MYTSLSVGVARLSPFGRGSSWSATVPEAAQPPGPTAWEPD